MIRQKEAAGGRERLREAARGRVCPYLTSVRGAVPGRCVGASQQRAVRGCLRVTIVYGAPSLSPSRPAVIGDRRLVRTCVAVGRDEPRLGELGLSLFELWSSRVDPGLIRS